MSGNEVICNVDITALDQTVYCDNKTYKFKTSELYSALNQLCYSQKNYSVHLYGNEDYIDGIMSDMFADEITKYGNNQIKVEVN